MTNKIIVRSTEEFMKDYTPSYQPFYPLLMGKSVAYNEEVGEVNFKRLEILGDVRARLISPKDTELKQITVGESKKTFAKALYGNQYTQSNYQSTEGNEEVVAQVLDEHQKQQDEYALFGGGTAQGNQINNGLIYSSDVNHVKEEAAAANDLATLFEAITSTVAKANTVAGQKVVVHYGALTGKKMNGLFSTTNPVAFRKVLTDALPGVQFVEIPSEVAPTGEGIVILNLNALKFHYVTLPKLANQGVNVEKSYSWHNFLMGSTMVEVTAKKGVIVQPLTFA